MGSFVDFWASCGYDKILRRLGWAKPRKEQLVGSFLMGKFHIAMDNYGKWWSIYRWLMIRKFAHTHQKYPKVVASNLTERRTPIFFLGECIEIFSGYTWGVIKTGTFLYGDHPNTVGHTPVLVVWSSIIHYWNCTKSGCVSFSHAFTDKKAWFDIVPRHKNPTRKHNFV